MSAVLIRPATVADLSDVERVRLATWKVAYRGIVSDAFLDDLQVTPERVARLAERLVAGDVRTHVADLDGEIVGMASHGPCSDEDLPGIPELYAVYVVPEGWGHGTGTALLSACEPVEVLWVLEGNERARAFYERHGFASDGTSRTLEHVGTPVVAVRFRRS